jgi:hypothetical protein
MATATHRGTCQICGRVQKLPHGYLAKHGYTVEDWGFTGTCDGSGYLPFEESTDRIQAAIHRGKSFAAGYRKDADAEEVAPVGIDAIVYGRIYIGSRDRRSWEKTGYQWASGRIVFRPNPKLPKYGDVGLEDSAGRFHTDCTGQTTADRSEECAAKYAANLRRLRAAFYREQAEKMDQYVAWQQARIVNWKPGKLMPVK